MFANVLKTSEGARKAWEKRRAGNGGGSTKAGTPDGFAAENGFQSVGGGTYVKSFGEVGAIGTYGGKAGQMAAARKKYGKLIDEATGKASKQFPQSKSILSINSLGKVELVLQTTAAKQQSPKEVLQNRANISVLERLKTRTPEQEKRLQEYKAKKGETMFSEVFKDSAASSKAWESRRRNSKAMTDANYKDLKTLARNDEIEASAKATMRDLRKQVKEMHKNQEEFEANHKGGKLLRASAKEIFTDDSEFSHTTEGSGTAFMDRASLARTVAKAKSNGYKVQASKELYHDELPGIPQTTMFTKGTTRIRVEADKNPADDFVLFAVDVEPPKKNSTKKSAFMEALLA